MLVPTGRIDAQQPTGIQADSTKRRPTTLQRVTVADSIPRTRPYTVSRTSSATRTSTLLRDVPQSATIISQGLISDQGMTGMADVVRYVPGITMGLGEGHRDAPTIRGNSSTSDFFIDGIRDDAQYYRDTYNVERVEALKGSNAMVFGRGGGGGVLNRVTKDAQWLPTRAIALTGGSFDQRRATLDVGQPFGKHVAARLNAIYENSATFREASGNERVGVNPTAALMFGRTMVRVGYEFYTDNRVVDRGLPSFNGAPSPAPISAYFGDPNQSNSRLTAQSAAATIDRQLWRGNASIDGIQLRNRSRFMTYDKFYSNVFPGAVNSAGTSVNLNGYDNGTDRRNLFNQTDLTATITRGALRQTLLVGAELGSQQTDNLRNTAYFGAPNSTATSFAVPFATPRATTPVTFRQSATDADNRTDVTTTAVYAQNQVEIGAHVQGVLGIRFDRLQTDFRNKRTGQELSRDDNLVSPRAGLVIKPVQPVSIYGSYSVSFLPSSGDQFSALTATQQTLEAERFTNREVGIKWDARENLALTAALYRLDRTNTTAPDPVTPSIIVQTGEQRTTGYELGISGAPTARWQVAGGYARQDARITSLTSAAKVGARVALVPRNTLSLWNRVQLLQRVGAGLGVVHQGAMFAAIDNTVTLPGFTRLDAAAFLTLTRTLRAQVNVENLLDRRYYITAHSNNNIMPGSSRMVRVALNVTP
ncbi:MAG TPA: TonB-dependent siderophore receptor [Gemmatimonadaceae bacterium]|nr:TonB-dependent siderophore receptor [Gemmatimonadaceae bacterium]